MNTSHLLLILADASSELYIFSLICFVLWVIYGIVRVVLKMNNGLRFSIVTAFLAFFVILAAIVPSKSTLTQIINEMNIVSESKAQPSIKPLTTNGKLSYMDTPPETTVYVIPPEKPKSIYVIPPEKPETTEPVDFEREVYGKLESKPYMIKTPNGIVADDAILPNSKKPPG